MIRYYIQLALRSLRRSRSLTALMIVAIALGIGASMTTLTVFYVLSGDPLPDKSDQLYYVQLDAPDMTGYSPGEEPPEQLTRYDAEALLAADRADRQALMVSGSVAIEPDSADVKPFYARTRYSSADFFPMFEVPFLFGDAWSADDDERGARVAVLSARLNDKLFGGANSVGRTVRIDQHELRIVGVIDAWRPVVRYYDLTSYDRFGETEELFVPFSTSRELGLQRNGSIDCWGEPGPDPTALNAPCTWMQFWAELRSPGQVRDYRAFLENYSEQQRTAGRYERPVNVRLSSLTDWLDFKQVVPADVRLQALLAFGFLAVCLLNTIGLLLAKFMRRSGEIGVRRALGAPRRAIFSQFLVEAGVIGFAGGLIGLGFALLGLWAVRQQATGYAQLAQLDTTMLATTLVLAVAASLIAGVLPAWHACRITPAIQLKSQ